MEPNTIALKHPAALPGEQNQAGLRCSEDSQEWTLKHGRRRSPAAFGERRVLSQSILTESAETCGNTWPPKCVNRFQHRFLGQIVKGIATLFHLSSSFSWAPLSTLICSIMFHLSLYLGAKSLEPKPADRGSPSHWPTPSCFWPRSGYRVG